MRVSYKVLIVILVLLMGASAAGCQAQQKGPVTVHVLAMEQAGPTADEMNAIVAEFNKANPNVKVEIEYVGLRCVARQDHHCHGFQAARL